MGFKIKHSQSGFTLIELILGLSLMMMLIGVSSNMIFLTTRSHDIAIEEYDLQNTMREASEKTNKIVRYSSALFTIPEGRFFEANLTDGWSYFGVSADKKEIIAYVYENRVNHLGVQELKHWKDVIVASRPNIEYNFQFHKNSLDTNNRILNFTIEGVLVGINQKKVVINSEVEALNALQVVDRGTIALPAVAIAYRADDRPVDQIVGVITMVMDVSGSMAWKLDGTSTSSDSESRLGKLKVSLNNMMTEFSKEEKIEMAIVPFSTSANYSSSNPVNGPVSSSANDNHPFYTLSNSTEKTAVETIVNSLAANGGTNTGDGMRRAYYRNQYFKTYVTNPASGYGAGHTTRDYMIILTDGVVTYHSLNGGSYLTADGRFNWSGSHTLGGTGSTESINNDAYVTAIGALIKSQNIKPYVIGYSSVPAQLNSVDKIATAVGADADDVFYFTDGLNLDDVFAQIKASIMKDLWHVRGPKL